MKKIFITDYVGLSTRLEALAIAFLISERFGHQICLDWQELDALQISGTRRGSRGLIGRLNSIKLKGDWAPDFDRIENFHHVNLRTHLGPEHLLAKMYLPSAQRVKLRSDLVELIKATFSPYAHRPLVGVHIRRGDFPLVRGDVFDVNATEWPAVPEWWYEHVMGQIQRHWPTVAFFVSCSGSLSDFPLLQAKFDVFDLPAASPYANMYQGHVAARHPAADLFALACCQTLIGSPCSTFSHYAANMLGHATQLLLPPAHPIHQGQASFSRAQLYGRGAGLWYAACRTGQGTQSVTEASTLQISNGAHLDWL
jgi:hypothetical protein